MSRTRVFVADGDRETRSLGVHGILQPNGSEALAVGDGVQGLDQAHSGDVDPIAQLVQANRNLEQRVRELDTVGRICQSVLTWQSQNPRGFDLP